MSLYSIHLLVIGKGTCQTAPVSAEDIKAFFPTPQGFEDGYLQLWSIERNMYVHWDEVYKELIINVNRII